MSALSQKAVTELIRQAGQGDRNALESLIPAVYGELRRMAAGYLRRERPGQTLQATGLVHEAYLRLLKDRDLTFQNRAHFFAIAARSMREILVERARARAAWKRGGGQDRITLEEQVAGEPAAPIVDILALDQALGRLARVDAQQARIVELRFFGGLTVEEAADALGVSPATVKRGWAVARAWLYRELAPGDS
jgi:RNA polymerase sigma factor (TIGR02999 family)